MQGEIALIISGKEIVVAKEKLMPEKIGWLEGRDIRWVDTNGDNAAVVERLKKIFSNVRSGIGMTGVLEAIEELPEDKREERTVICLTGIFEEIKDKCSKNAVIGAIRAIPLEERAEIIEETEDFARGLVEGSEIEDFISMIRDIPLMERANVVKSSKALVDMVRGLCNKQDIINIMKQVPLEERASVVDNVRIILEATGSRRNLEPIIEIVKGIPMKDRTNVVKNAGVLLKGIEDRFVIATVVKAINETPVDDRPDVVSRTKLFIEKGIRNGYGIKAIVEAVRAILPEDRSEVIERAGFFLEGVDDGYIIETILGAIGAIPGEEREEVIEMAKFFVAEVYDGYAKKAIIKAIGSIPKEEREDVIKKVKDLVDGVEDGYLKRYIIDAVGEIPHGERKNIEKVKELFDIPDGRQVLGIIQFFMLVPPREREKVIEEMVFDEELKKKPYTLLAGDHNIRETVHQYVFNLLDRVIVDQKTAFRLSKMIIDNKNALLIYDEHPLFQKAIEVMVISNPEIGEEKKNCYKIFNELKKAANEEKLVEVAISSQVIDGQKVAWDQKALREISRYKMATFTFADLPKEVYPDSLEKLFDKMDRRIKELSEAERKRVYQEIDNIIGETFKNLKEDILRSSVIRNFLKIEGKPEDKISNTNYYTYVIVKAILDANDKLEDKELLTEQESLLMKVAASIQNCATGQRDGIDRIYCHMLPAKYRLKGGQVPAEEGIVNLVYGSIQRLMKNIIESKDLLREITGKPSPAQESHQTLYLKNRLFRHIGLEHSLSFDSFTGVIYDELIDAKTEELLDKFYRRLSSKETFTLLRQIINSHLEEIGVANLTDFIKSKILGMDFEAHFPGIYDYLKLDEENYTDVDITEKCMRDILLHFGLLREVE